MIASVNPSTEEVLRTFEPHSPEQIDSALDLAQLTFQTWRRTPIAERSALLKARDAGEAIRIANATPFGLGASLWTRDLDRARNLAGQIEAGQVFINGMVSSDPRLPFGGIKKSGYGRELSELGLREFVNIQTVWIA